jgi:hypothetical protein
MELDLVDAAAEAVVLCSSGVWTLASRACSCISALPASAPSCASGAVSSCGALKRSASRSAWLPSNRL